MGPAQRVRIHIANRGGYGDATGTLVGFVLRASAARPQSGRSSGFLGVVAGPSLCYGFDVIKTVEDGEGAAKEGRPPCMWDRETAMGCNAECGPSLGGGTPRGFC